MLYHISSYDCKKQTCVYTKILKQIIDSLEEVPGLAINLLPAVMGKAISVF